MGKRIISRVYLKDKTGLHEFFWFSEGKDSSLYFGSSITKLLKKGFCGNGHAPIEGASLDYTKGRKLADIELKEKISLHKSGIINNSTHENGERTRSYSIPLLKYEDIIPVASIVPMQIGKYPITKKTIRVTDIIIDLVKSNYLPMAIFFYTKERNKENPQIINKMQNEWSFTNLITVNLKKWMLCALMYSSCRHDMEWPDLEITIMASPDENGKINVPIFGQI